MGGEEARDERQRQPESTFTARRGVGGTGASRTGSRARGERAAKRG